MSTRSERAERKNGLSGVTGCNYGSHPFERQDMPGRLQRGAGGATHMHYCPDCGAEYFASDPCWCTPGEPVALGHQAVREISALIERLVDSPPKGKKTWAEHDEELEAWHIQRSEALAEIANIIGREKDAAAHQSDAGKPEHGQQQPPADPPD